MTRLRLLAGMALLLAAAAGCNDNDSPTAPAIDEPEEVPMFTNSFMGEIGQGQTSCHVFTTQSSGTANLRLTDLQPLATLTVGLGLGLDDGDAMTPCSYFASDSSVRVGDVLESRLASIASYCVCVFDVGNIFPDRRVDYTLEVEHP